MGVSSEQTGDDPVEQTWKVYFAVPPAMPAENKEEIESPTTTSHH